MRTYPLIRGSIFAVVFLVLGSLSNVIGYQSVQTSHQNLIRERINQRELLFQTIVDIANNREIKQIIYKSQMNRGIFPPSAIPVLTKNQIRLMYFLGLILSKVISKSRMQSIINQYQVSDQGVQKKISSVIEKDSTLNGEITQLSSLKCNCGNDNITRWNFPVLCMLLAPIITLLLVILAVGLLIFHVNLHFFAFLLKSIGIIGSILNCSWSPLV